MNEYFEENKRSLILLAIVFALLAIVLYILLVHPLVSEYKDEVHKLETTEEEIEQLQSEIKRLREAADQLDWEQLLLENKIPTERELDEYILSLQALEIQSNSIIESLDFTYDSQLQLDEEVEAGEEGSEDEEDGIGESADAEDEAVDSADGDEASDEERDSQVSIDPALLAEKPEALNVMTVRMKGASPNFDDFLNLLALIEKEERISIVTHLKFEKPTEVDIYFEDEAEEAILFEAEITSFYYQ